MWKVYSMEEVAMNNLLEVRNLTKIFPIGHKKAITAVNDISFEIMEQETFGLIGESGSGKSTVGRCLLNLIRPTSGTLIYKGIDYSAFTKQQQLLIRKEMQMVFQDPHYSLNPRVCVWDTVLNTLKVDRTLTEQRREEMAKVALDSVYIKEAEYGKFAHQLSAGQQQRVGIARAIASRPKFIVLDEPTSSLDVSIRAEIIDLLNSLQASVGMSYLFISHDLSTIKYLCHRVAVMYLGSIVEYGTAEDLFLRYSHPYSKALLASVMIPDPNQKRSFYRLSGEIPSSINLPKGCALASRCSEANEICFRENPEMKEVEPGHFVKCHFARACDRCIQNQTYGGNENEVKE